MAAAQYPDRPLVSLDLENAFGNAQWVDAMEATLAKAKPLAAALASQLGYLISKGGITTHTLLADGLGLARVELQGQLLPGLSLVLTPSDGGVPGLPVLNFPGNLGDSETLRAAWWWMEGREQRP
jgi:uncharacterized protein YgbK (DUF1537 family)